MIRIEETIIAHLLYDDAYCRKATPHLKPDYFANRIERVVLETTVDFFNKYAKAPTHEALTIEIGNRRDITETEVREAVSFIGDLDAGPIEADWLLDKTEEFCKTKAVAGALMESIIIMDGKDKNRTPDAIPSILTQALAVSFQTTIGHDYFEAADDRYDFYHSPETGIKFDIDLLNKITGGVGLRNKTLTCIAAMTGGGKSLFMSHVAAATLMQGKNVLYITMEMSEQRIAERVDANLFNTPIGQLKNLDKSSFKSRVDRIAAKTVGKLVVKEYPTSSAHSGHFRALIQDLRLKKGFKPDLIIIDYLNICASARLKAGNNVNSYTYVKAIAEELRGLAVEFDVPILTGTQVNRGGINNSDLEMTDTSESMGLVHALDLYLAMIRTEELDALNQVMIKQLKNRYGDIGYYKRFVIGLDRSRMKLYNLEDDAQDNLADAGSRDKKDVPAFDKTRTGKSIQSGGQGGAGGGGSDFDFDFGDD